MGWVLPNFAEVSLAQIILMTAIGLVVGVIVVLLYMPIFDLAGSF
jgi:type II secretory pathway component PulF